MDKKKKYDFHFTLHGALGKKLRNDLLKIKIKRGISFSDWMARACLNQIKDERN